MGWILIVLAALCLFSFCVGLIYDLTDIRALLPRQRSATIWYWLAMGFAVAVLILAMVKAYQI